MISRPDPLIGMRVPPDEIDEPPEPCAWCLVAHGEVPIVNWRYRCREFICQLCAASAAKEQEEV